MLFRALDGRLLPISRIESVSTAQERQQRTLWIVRLDGGSEVEIDAAGYESLVPAIGAVPAMPDTYLLDHCSEDDDSESVTKIPVIAWIIRHERAPIPVTANGPCNTDLFLERPLATLMPDGTVLSGSGSGWDNFDQYLRLNDLVPGRLFLEK